MAQNDAGIERRKQQRLSVEFPLSYKIGRKTLIGCAVNASNQGMMIESFLSSRMALEMFKMLGKMPSYRLEVEFSYEGNIDLRDAVIKHFHFDFAGYEAYRFTIGFRLLEAE